MNEQGEIVVVGAGAVGLVAALAAARVGRSVVLVGPPGMPRPGRTVALLQGSVDLLRKLDVWAGLESAAEPLRTMRIVDATGSLFAPPPVSFDSAEIGLPAFGYNIDNARLETALREAAAAEPRIRPIADEAVDAAFAAERAEVRLASGERIHAALVVGADGRDSRMRKAARIGVRAVEHPQRAMTAIFDHGAPHENISTEFHTREGPFTLVPMPEGDGRRSSLVWVMSPAEAKRRGALDQARFTQEAERQCGRLLGRMTLASGIGTFPIVTRSATRLVASRLVLLGEAAHALPPIGAQGLNLSFRDVGVLVDCLSTRSAAGADIGSPSVLARYERSRRGDVAARIIGVDLLNDSLLTHGAAMDFLRGMGLAALGRVTPLRKLVMRYGLAPGARRSVVPLA